MPAGILVTVLIAVQNITTCVLMAVALYCSATWALKLIWGLLRLLLFLVFLRVIRSGISILSHPRLPFRIHPANQPDPPQATPTRQPQARTEQRERRDEIAVICDELHAIAEVSYMLLVKGDGCADVVKRLQNRCARIGPPPPPYDATPPTAYST